MFLLNVFVFEVINFVGIIFRLDGIVFVKISFFVILGFVSEFIVVLLV